jgi:hypothetical protein
VPLPPYSDGPSMSSDELCNTNNANRKVKGKEPILEILSESNDYSSEEGPVEEPPTKKVKRRDYNLTRRYHIEWSAKHAWAVPFIDDGHHYVKCETCTTMDGRPYIMMPKIDTLQVYKGQQKVRVLTLFLSLLYS